MGNVRKNAETKKKTFIDIGKAKKYEVTRVESSSPFVTAREIVSETTSKGPDSVGIEITIAPGIPAGLLSEKIVVHFKEDLRPRAKFFLYGIVVDDIEISPLVLQFTVGHTDTGQSIPGKLLTITNYMDDFPLEITGIDVPGGIMKTSVKILEPGRKFEITAEATENMFSPGVDSRGNIRIKTNNSQYEVLEVPFRVEKRP